MFSGCMSHAVALTGSGNSSPKNAHAHAHAHANNNNSIQLESIFRDALSSSRKKNCRLRFLILLRDEDYYKWFWSRKDMIWYRKNKFPGQLILERFSELDTLPYIIEGPPIPRKLYIMLPKEKLFIPSDHFTSRYIDSKLQELKIIFSSLQAKSIKVKKIYGTHESRQIHASAGIQALDVSVHGSRQQNRQVYTVNEMTFGEPYEHLSIESLTNDSVQNKYFYLAKEYEWQNIILRRLKDRMITDKYIYRNTEQKLFTAKFTNALKLLDISAEYDWKQIQHLEIHYDIEYYDFSQLYTHREPIMVDIPTPPSSTELAIRKEIPLMFSNDSVEMLREQRDQHGSFETKASSLTSEEKLPEESIGLDLSSN
jgi:hypothetical protein